MASATMVPANGSPVVSVIVPFFRDEDYIRHTLQSVKVQTFQNFECLLVDDMGQDGSSKIALEFARADKRFRIISHKANSGLSAARNTGIAAAQGTYLQFLDADDMLATDALETRLGTLKKYPFAQVAGAYCTQTQVGVDFRQIMSSTQSVQGKIVDFYTSKGACPFSVHQPLVRTDVVRLAGGFNESFTTAEDHELWFRILRNGYCFVPSDFLSAFYRMKPGTSMATTTAFQHLANSHAIISAARQPMPEEMKIPGAPFHYSEPWDYYDAAVNIAARALSFGAMAGPAGIARAIHMYLPADTHFVVGRHVSTYTHIASGKARARGMIPKATPRSVGDYFVDTLGEVSTSVTKSDWAAPHPQSPERAAKGVPLDLLFLPHKDYHVETINSFRAHFERAGVSFGIVDFARKYRDEGAVGRARELGMKVFPISMVDFDWLKPRCVVTFNDWDPVVRDILMKYRDEGVGAIGIVEGVQDYDDVDTGRTRRPYQFVDHVLVPGAFDLKYFEHKKTRAEIGGVANVERLWLAPFTKPRSRSLVANVNFSYNVLEEARDGWIASVQRASEQCGVDIVVSQHPADRGDLSSYNVSSDSIYDELEQANILVSRFSTVIFEALAMGRRAVYFNPHGEKIDKFVPGNPALIVANTEAELVDALEVIKDDVADNRKVVAEYLHLHCNVDTARKRAVVAEHLARRLLELGGLSKRPLTYAG